MTMVRRWVLDMLVDLMSSFVLLYVFFSYHVLCVLSCARCAFFG